MREGREREGQREGERGRTKKEGMRMGPNLDCCGWKDRERRGERGKKKVAHLREKID